MVTELDKLVRAREVIAKLGEGVDPITDAAMPKDTILNNARLSRCFVYVAGVLEQVIADYGKPPQREENLPPFHITDEELRRVAVGDVPVNITGLITAIAGAAPGRRRLSVTAVTAWLTAQGYLKTAAGADGKSHRGITEKGAALGIYSEMREGVKGRYMAVLYPPKAQRFILAHLRDILVHAETGKAGKA